MRLICLFVLGSALTICMAKEQESSEASPPLINLDSNLRRALLKALTELENEDNEKNQNPASSEKFVEKASASAVSIFANSDSSIISTTPKLFSTSTQKQNEDEEETGTEESSTETEQPYVLIQKSKGVQHNTITTIEHDEQIQTSASNSFSNSGKYVTKSAINEIDTKSTEKLGKVEITTPSVPPPSTEENEAKVEDVQFFSAPLVAAFTVHQDALGQPKKVEAIFKPPTKKSEPQLPKQDDKLILNNRLSLQQKALEDEILRLKQKQQQQELLLRQQLLKEKLLQEQIRIRNNESPFHPMVAPDLSKFQNSNTKSVSVQPSITFDPLLEAGKLPSNAQILPIKNAVDFRTPLVQTPTFQQLHSVTQRTPTFEQQPHFHKTQPLESSFPKNNFNSVNFQITQSLENNFPKNSFQSNFQDFPKPQVTNNFPLLDNSFQTNFPKTQKQQITLENSFQQRPQFNFSPPESNRILRQESGTGNFFNNDFGRNTDSFSIQKSLQPPVIPSSNFFNAFESTTNPNSNRFFRSNLESNFVTPQTFSYTNNIQPLQNSNSNRFFRSNLESSVPHQNSYRLDNLLYNSGAFLGRQGEDLNIISKVLSLNHLGSDNHFASSNLHQYRVPVPYYKNV